VIKEALQGLRVVGLTPLMKINRHFQQLLAKDRSWREGERKPFHRNGEVEDCLIIWQASPEEQ